MEGQGGGGEEAQTLASTQDEGEEGEATKREREEREKRREWARAGRERRRIEVG